MSRCKSREIDNVDLKKIINKSIEIKQIIGWLDRLKKLDSSVNAEEIDKAILDLAAKMKILDMKAKEAQEDMTEEANLLNMLYNGD